ncbi:transcriptional regulator family: Fungal Specific TF [Trichoderma aggressivum f. europaeum]|uniref:Transcriptional regulator family: Fungal Specific TF n=1 Tax=Trichoderma aggressivum f. europaeum TaxID=173218 RepID=A0AAE1M1F5_9HYPO|nr:transcriptional regulator family: Fungal Specific TF [Trichoderma aggressivum f. europaeum]
METRANRQSSLPQSSARRLARKRKRYVFQACERCKQQKIRCNGKKPCDRCEKRRPEECVYKLRDSLITELNNVGAVYTNNGEVEIPAGASSHREPPPTWDAASALDLAKIIQAQSEKLDLLLQRTEGNSNGLNKRLAGEPEEHIPINAEQYSAAMSYKHVLPFFRGPSGMTFYMSAVGMIGSGIDSTDRETYSTLDGEIIVESSCENIQNDSYDRDIDDFSIPATAKPLHGLPFSTLEEIDGEMAVHLVHLYDTFVGVTHPILPIGVLMRHVRKLYPALAAESHSSVQDILAAQMGRSDLNIIKMVFGIALVIQDSSHEAAAAKFHASIQRDVDNTIWAATAEIGDLQVLILVSIYHSIKGNSRLAWRIVGNLTRLILEFGLHKGKVLMSMFKEPSSYKLAVNMFWTAFVLDCQLSYSLGLPRHIQDKDIDNSIPLPGDSPYLLAMIDYCRLGSRICESISNVFGGSSHYAQEWRESFDFFQDHLSQWQEKHVPKVLDPNIEEPDAKKIRHFQTLLYLRANQLRLVLIRPALYSFQLQEATNSDLWATTVNIACDSFQILLDLFGGTDIYKMQQTQYNYFLITALGAVLGVLAQEKSALNAGKVDGATLAKAREFVTASLDLLKLTAISSKTSEHQYAKVMSLCRRLGLLTPSGTPNPLLDSFDVGLFQEINGDADFSHFLLPEYQLGPMWADLDFA